MVENIVLNTQLPVANLRDEEYGYEPPEYQIGQKIWLLKDYEEYVKNNQVKPKEYKIIGTKIVEYTQKERLIKHPKWMFNVQIPDNKYSQEIWLDEMDLTLPHDVEDLSWF